MQHQTRSPSFNITESTNFGNREIFMFYIWVLFDKIFRKTTFQKKFEKGRVQRKYTFMRTFCESNKNFGLNLPHEQLQMRKL